MSGEVRARVREVLLSNLRGTTGDCVCIDAYTDRNLVDPQCGWHEAEGTTDEGSVDAVLAAVADVDALTSVLEGHRRINGSSFDGYSVWCWCEPHGPSFGQMDDGVRAHERHIAEAVAAYILDQA